MSALRAFRMVFAASRRIDERLTPAGKGALAVTLLAAAFGLDTQVNYAHGVFSLGAALLAVDFLSSLRARADVEVRRRLPDFLTGGQPGRYALVVRNCGTKRIAGLFLNERLRQPFPTAEEFARRDVSIAAAGNLFDRLVGYPDWIEWLRRLRCVAIDPIRIPPLAPGESVEIDVPIQPVHRGLAVFEQPTMAQLAPLGLCQACRVIDVSRVRPASQSVPVLPARHDITLPAADSRRNLQPGGISLAMRVGDSEEFRALRDYRPGDSLRSIHWRSWARTGRPVVREFQDEFFSRHALLIDTAAPALFDPSLEAAVSLAASLVQRPREADSLLDMLFVGDRVHCLTAGRGLGETASLLRVLATVAPTPKDGFRRLANTALQGAARIGSLVCILLQWDDERRQFVERMRALGVSPLVYVVARPPAGDVPADLPGLRWLDPAALSGTGTVS